MKDLMQLSMTEIKHFMDSFDTVITDCNGVLWNDKPLPGVKETIQALKENGKKIHFITNNSFQFLYVHMFEEIGVQLNANDLIHPTNTLINYLQDIKFNKKVFCISSNIILKLLDEANINYCVAPDICEEEMPILLTNIADDPDVGAVFIDMDINVNYVKILKAISLLKRSEVLFLVGALDKILPISSELFLLGPGAFQKIISEFSGRKPIILGKPSEYLKNKALRQFQINDPKRVLFVGDLLETDMAFATMCGFQNLLVLSGCSTFESIRHIHEPAQQPQYYIKSFGHLNKIISSDKKH